MVISLSPRLTTTLTLNGDYDKSEESGEITGFNLDLRGDNVISFAVEGDVEVLHHQ